MIQGDLMQIELLRETGMHKRIVASCLLYSECLTCLDQKVYSKYSCHQNMAGVTYHLGFSL